MNSNKRKTMKEEKGKKKMSTTAKVMIGIGSGILAGVILSKYGSSIWSGTVKLTQRLIGGMKKSEESAGCTVENQQSIVKQ